MAITLRHFIETYTQGARRFLGLKAGGRQGPNARGIFTSQYPEERVALPERFRVLPVLLYEEETGAIRCTACGICTKVCPPQCIWIVQARGEDGKPRMRPEEYVIETNVCMNCGLCAEFCPFDAIKMDHRFELASQDSRQNGVRRLPDLLVSTAWYARTHPGDWVREEEARRRKAAPKSA
jgi:NADH-quinone oxidoreductase subunit I